MGPKHCKTKHMANLDGTTSDPGWDLDGPRLALSEGSPIYCRERKNTSATAFFICEQGTKTQKNRLSVRAIFVCNSGAGNGCVNFMDTWKNAFFLQEKPCP